MTDTPKTLGYGRQWISEEDLQAVRDVLTSTHLTQGPKSEEFEKALCKTTGAEYATVVNSGTSALHIACLAARISEGDEVITSPNTFVASANCAFYCGATPVFADIDKATGLIDPKEIESKLTSRTRAIIPVQFAGQHAPMEEIYELAQRHGQKIGHKVFVIEDAAHSLGALYQNTPSGSCAFSDMTIFSFHPVKHITTGEGGAVLTNDPELSKRLTLFKSHGITRDPEMVEDNSNAPWGYEQHELGFNYRITDIQCALGISQIQRIEGFVKRRQEIAGIYRKEFEGSGNIGTLSDRNDGTNSHHLFVVTLPFDDLGGRSNVMMKLREKGIITQVHYIPVHTQPYFKKRLGTKWGDFPEAEEYYKSCLSIPMFPAMTNDDVARVVTELNALF